MATYTSQAKSGCPRVTVLMPVRDGARYLRLALASIRAQVFEDLELIAVDDGSEDQSPTILAQAAAADHRIRPLLLGERVGIVEALNRGLAEARGVLIARLDADDTADPHRIGLQEAFLRTHPDVLVVGSNIRYIDRDGDALAMSCVPMEHEDIDRVHMSGIGGALVHGSSMFRKAAVLEVGGYRAEFSAAEDLDLFLRLAERGRLANVPELLVDVRLHSFAHSRLARERQREQSFEAMRQAHARRGLAFHPARFRFPQVEVDTYGTSEHLARLALEGGNVPTARKHALYGVLKRPHVGSAWRTMVRTLLPHWRRQDRLGS